MVSKQNLFAFLLVLSVLFSFRSGAQSSVEYSIFTPPGFPEETKNDFIDLLDKGSGFKWRSSDKEPVKGIILKLADHPSFKTKESFRVQSNGSDLLTISSSSTEGLVFGLYKHLRSLGYKFYLPGELYTIIPSVKNLFGTKKDVVDRPFLEIRNFGGTGGFGTNNPDPDKSVERSWTQWKLRNGFGAAYHLSGHRGEDFILENKARLSQNPQWLASPLTNGREDMTIKLNYLNKDAANFYADWTIKAFTDKNYKPLPPGHTDLVSIEPSDGGGYLNDFPRSANKDLPSISDQVYGLANLAAQKLDRLFPDRPNIGVNLYAYNTHAAPPSFPLNPRVFVQLVPYQFQNVAYGPSFIKLWASKVKRFGLYDYLKYADAQFDVPGGITLEESMQRLVSSAKMGSEGTTYETSYSKFSTGIILWTLVRYMADGDGDWKKNVSLLEQDLYGNAKGPVGELFNLLYSEPSFNVNYLGNAITLVDRASQLEKEQAVQKRLQELKQYFFFVHLAYQSRDLANGNFEQRLVPVASYAWKLYETGIIHSYRIMQLVSYTFLNTEKSDKNYAHFQTLSDGWFPETPRSKATWSKISQGQSPQEIEQDFALLKNKYRPSKLNQSYGFQDVNAELKTKFKPIKTFVVGGDQTSRGYFGIYAEKPTEVKIKYMLTGQLERKLTISSIDKTYSNPLALIADKESGEMKFSVLPGETTFFINASPGTSYRMQVKADDGVFFFDGAPRGVMAFYKNISDPVNTYTYEKGFYPSYVFIPKNTQTINYKVQLNALALTSPSGKKPTSKILQTEHAGFEIRELNIDASESGHLWKAEISGNYNYNFLNIPDRYFLLEQK